MSDNDDAHSEVAPEGWGAMYNNLMNPGKPASTSGKSSVSSTKSQSKQPQNAGWLGGWFGSNTSNTKPKSDDDKEEDNGDDDASGSSSGSGSEESSADMNAPSIPDDQAPSDVDSDGFAKDPSDDVGAMLNAGSDSVFLHNLDSVSDMSPSAQSARYSVGDVGAMMDPGFLRKERIRKRQQYLPTAVAAEVALPEEAPSSNQTSLEPATSPSGGFWTSWFGASTAAAPAAVDPVSKSSESPPEKPAEISKSEPVTKPKSSAEQARSLLPSLPEPPAYEVDSFFMSPGGSFFQPSQPVMRFEGRLRGLPRQISPYWSSQGIRVKPPEYKSKTSSSGNPSTTLYMFRVS